MTDIAHMAAGLVLAWIGLALPWLRAPLALVVTAFLVLGGLRTPWTAPADGALPGAATAVLRPLPRPAPEPLPLPAPKPVRVTDLLDQMERTLL